MVTTAFEFGGHFESGCVLLCPIQQISHRNDYINSNSVGQLILEWNRPQIQIPVSELVLQCNSNPTELGGIQGIPIFVLQLDEKG